MSDTSLAFNFLKGRDTASPHMRTVANNATAMSNRIRAASILSAAGTAVMVAGFAALGAQGVALVSSLGPLIGLLGLLPALSFAAAGGIVSLILGFSGLAAAMKRSAGGAGASGAAIEAAERRIAMAQRQALEAQQALNDARESAAQRIADLARELAGARLDEEGAVLAVARAEANLRDARRHGSGLDIAEAELAYRQALQTLDDVRTRTQRLAEEQRDASAKGVEGSDEVTSALQRQADAAQELAEAQKALARAGAGGGGVDRAAEAYARLAPAARQLVDTLRSLGPAWRGVQQAMQQAMLAGVAADVGRLSQVYLPVMRAQLPAIAAGWNAAFRDTARMATTAAAVADTNTILANTAAMWQRVGRSFAPFLVGFRHFAVVGSRFLPGIGDWVLRIGQRFERWAAAARESGRAQAWISTGLTTLGQLWQVVRNLGSAIASVFRAGSGGPGWLAGLVSGTAALSAWLASPVGQGKLAAVFSTLRTVGSKLWEVLQVVATGLLDLIPAGGRSATDTLSVFGTVVGFAADHLDLLAKAMPFLVTGFIVLKSAQVLATVAAVADVPVRIWQSVVMWRHTAALKANTAAMATSTGMQRKSLVALAASKVALAAQAVWTGIATAAVWAWNVAVGVGILPLLGIIAVIAALIVVIVLVVRHWDFFKHWALVAINAVWGAIQVGWGWIKDHWPLLLSILTGPIGAAVIYIIRHWDQVVGFVKALPGRIASAASGMWDGIKNAFRAAINWIISKWNGLHFGIPSMDLGPLGHVGGQTFYVPQLPYLDRGGDVMRSGLAVIHEGERVVRAAEVRSPVARGAGPLALTIDTRGGGGPVEQAIATMIHYLVRTGRIQLATPDGSRVRVGGVG